MKIVATYRTSRQTSPDNYEDYTKVIHLSDNMTLKEAIEEITKDWSPTSKNGDVQLSFEN